jgi:hypothetical protein
VGQERNQALRFIVEPLLITEEEVDDHHRSPDEVKIKISLEETHLGETIE